MIPSSARHNRISHPPLSGDRQEVAALWQEIFHDTDTFMHLFFSRVYHPENTLVIKRNNRILSALHMIPCRIKIARRILPSAYLCGAATLPSERGKGLMTTLMTESTNVMRRKGYHLSTLIPAEPRLFDFYKKFGYIHPINHKEETYHSAAPTPVTPGRAITPSNLTGNYTIGECTTDKYYPFFERKQHERPCALLHDVHDFETILQDLKHESGGAWILFRENNPVAIAFAKPANETTIHIEEILYDNPSEKEALIGHLLALYNVRTAKVRHPVDWSATTSCAQIRPYGLACTLTPNNEPVSDLYMTLMLD
jgi:predicted acetyltransferase